MLVGIKKPRLVWVTYRSILDLYLLHFALEVRYRVPSSRLLEPESSARVSVA
jgi:hypothetical protein